MSSSDQFCIYVTYHRTGKFYVGKGITANVESGKYSGSGKILLDAFKKYPKSEWVTDVVKTFDTEEDAYLAEAFYVDQDLINDSMCLNINLGGKGGSRRIQSQEERTRRSVSLKKALSSGERRLKMSIVSKESMTPELRAKFSALSKKRWDNPDERIKILESRIRSCGEDWKAKISKSMKNVKLHNSKSVELNGVVFDTLTAAVKATGYHPAKLRKQLGFKELC